MAMLKDVVAGGAGKGERSRALPRFWMTIAAFSFHVERMVKDVSAHEGD